MKIPLFLLDSIINITTTKVFFLIVRTMDRYGVWNWIGAAIVSVTLQDVSLIILKDMTQVVDHIQVCQCSAKYMKNLM